MYTPKIDEYYIPILYRLAKKLRVPMTRLVNAMIASGIREIQKAKRNEHMKKKRGLDGQKQP
jgi:hypothetical protein